MGAAYNENLALYIGFLRLIKIDPIARLAAARQNR